MRQAIVTKHLGPTNSRGSRVKATAQPGSITYHWDDALNSDENHTSAARMYAEKYGWLQPGWTLEGGGMPGGDGNCYVLVHGIVPALPDTNGREWLLMARDAFIEGRYDRGLAIIESEIGREPPFIYWNNEWWQRPVSSHGHKGYEILQGVRLHMTAVGEHDALGIATRLYLQASWPNGGTRWSMRDKAMNVEVFAIASSVDELESIVHEHGRVRSPGGRVGLRIVTVRPVDRFPHVMIPIGTRGVITTDNTRQISARLDTHFPGLDEWDNEVQWEDDSLGDFPDDVRLL